ncbi:DUF3307 domain-containing protein [Halostreptopolyspora alba]|uniref:DUF3307 domain-containing protein n=1 Tax=Halostreptopolyspora alba TaxID=2487137 RepID=A0A3N0DYM3_9ACTN|nr:DUF3307 domain-containing protein [Nocardiopsaceae bacterium YIM 96095]
MMADPITAALHGLALYAGHHVGDYWIQTDHQAQTKGECSHQGRLACAGHVATLTATQLVMVTLVAWATGLAIDPRAVVLGLMVNAVSHYWADRRRTLRGLVLALDPVTGKRGFYENAPGAPLQLDQAFHIGWIIPVALITAAPAVLALQLTGGALLVLLACAVASHMARRAERRQEHAVAA